MNDKWEILHGDALKLLGGFAPGAFDAVITDPPYASGGRTQAEKNKSTAKKYSSMGDHAPPPFDGDAKDQRSWTRWAAQRYATPTTGRGTSRRRRRSFRTRRLCSSHTTGRTGEPMWCRNI